MRRRYTLLGQFLIEEEGQPSPLMSSGIGCSLVAYLIFQQKPLSRELLADLLWDSNSTSESLSHLRKLIARIRKSVPELEITRQTLAFKPQPETIIDLYQLNTALNSADLAQIEEGLRLYQGELLEGFNLDGTPRLTEWLFIEQERLRHRMIAAYRQICEAYAGNGAWTATAAAAKRWLTLDELDEEAVHQLIKAHYAAGQLNRASQEYEVFRGALMREFGAEPKAAMRALYENIKAQLQVRKQPALSFVTQPRHNLPTQSTPFIGREAELTKIRTLLANPDCRLITIIAAGGMGKTRLALAAAEKHHSTIPNRVIFVPLAAVRKANFDSSVSPLAGAIADALNFNFQGGKNPEAQLLGFLENQDMLLLIDNFEHLLETADFLSMLLTQSPGVKIIVTSRERLNLYEEWLFPLEGLPHSSAQLQNNINAEISLEDLEGYGAIQLFLERAKQAKLSFSPVGQINDIVRIAQLVEGMPLGLELAAAWVRQLSCADIVQEIEQEIDFLATNMRNVPERHRSLRAVFEHTWQGLSNKEKLVLQKLSVFRGGFQRDAARKVADANLRLLTTFVDKSLLSVVGANRYGLHELMRHFIAEKLADKPKLEQQTLVLHGETYLKLLSDLESAFIGKNLPVGLNSVERDIDNIKAAWLWGASQNQIHLLNDALATVFQVCLILGWFLEAKDLMKMAVESLQYTIQSEKAAFSQKEVQLYKARFVGALATFQMYIGQYEEAETNFQTSLSLFQDIVWDIDRFRGQVIGAYARFLQYSGRLPKARQILLETLHHLKGVDDNYTLGFIKMVLSQLERFNGHFKEAKQLALESKVIAEGLKAKELLSFNLGTLGRVAMAQGRYDEADDYFRDCLNIRINNQLYASLASIYYDISNVARLRGDMTQAKKHYKTTLEISTALNYSYFSASAIAGLGHIALAEGDYDAARKNFAEYKKTGIFIGSLRRGLGWLALKLGDFSEARQEFCESLQLKFRAQNFSAILWALAGLVYLEAYEGKPEQAFVFLTLILNHHACTHELKTELSLLQSELIAELSAADVAAAEAAGTKMTLDEMIHYFLPTDLSCK